MLLAEGPCCGVIQTSVTYTGSADTKLFDLVTCSCSEQIKSSLQLVMILSNYPNGQRNQSYRLARYCCVKWSEAHIVLFKIMENINISAQNIFISFSPVLCYSMSHVNKTMLTMVPKVFYGPILLLITMVIHNLCLQFIDLWHYLIA